ncbi:hypothetical protein HAX54_013514 [Datura stramonium]|uniref:Cytochrome P450 n=1 Tax=Datura stramonium TaxID=4076 RepID=A0ABS8TN52_DATST|nr:hypothetical protein [Datura stramonium]
MEIQYSSPFNIVSLLLFFLLLILFRQSKKRDKKRRLLPPGPWRLPLIGSLHHLIGRLPHHSLTSLAQRYGPIMYLQLGEIPVVVISSPRIAKEVLSTHGVIFANRPEITFSNVISYNKKNIGFSEYGDYWRQMRKICTLELLSAKMIKSFSGIRRDEISILISSIRSMRGSRVNINEKVFQFTNSVLCRAAFGKICRSQAEFLAIVKEAFLLGTGFDVADLFPSLELLHKVSGLKSKLMNLHHKLDALMEDILNEHIENKATGNYNMRNGEFGGEDLVDVLLRIKENGELQCPISNDHIKAVILDMFAAGSETPSTTIIWAFSEMLKNPNVIAKAQSEVREMLKGKKNYDEEDLEKLRYLKLVIKETLRLHPPAPLLVPRESIKQIDIDGYTIPLKTRALVNAWALGRDPRSWHDPESFIPERFENSSIDFMGNHYEFIPFGAGKRICPGISFGLTNIALLLAQLLYHFEWELPDGANPKELDMTETHGILATKEKDLYLVATDYKNDE